MLKEFIPHTVQVEKYSYTAVPTALKGTDMAIGVHFPEEPEVILKRGDLVAVNCISEETASAVGLALLHFLYRNKKMPDVSTIEKMVQEVYQNNFGESV